MSSVYRAVCFACAVVIALAVSAGSEAAAQSRAGGFYGKAKFAGPSYKARRALSRTQQRNLIAQRRARQAVIRADRAFAWPPRTSRNYSVYRGGTKFRAATAGFIGGYGYAGSIGNFGNVILTEPAAPPAPVRGGPVSINDIPATTGIAAAPTPEPAFYDIRRQDGGAVTMVRRSGPRIVEMGATQSSEGETAAPAGPRIIRIP